MIFNIPIQLYCTNLCILNVMNKSNRIVMNSVYYENASLGVKANC